MKKCPYCKAEIADESVFCHYCMTSLDEKKSVDNNKKPRRRLPLVISLISVFLALGVILCAVFLFDDDKQNEKDLPAVNKEFEEEEAPDLEGYPVVTYSFRPAEPTDDHYGGYIPGDNDIVITGVQTVSENGIYYIPDTIDGHKVRSIDSLAFSDEAVALTLKKVIVGKDIRNIFENAFAGCDEMSDIYLMGESIYIDAFAFSDDASVTFHCSLTCNDRDLRLYKNKCETFGASFEEWQGERVEP